MHNPTAIKAIEKSLADQQHAEEQLQKLKQQKRFVDASEKLAVVEAVLDGLKREFPAEFEAVVNPETDETDPETASEEAETEADSSPESDETDPEPAHSDPPFHVDSDQNW